jgi:hypothetical protein
MTTFSLYHWDYDRREPSSDMPFLTFSIAIFQWQPKASGKGLKKVNACRVHGYGLDPGQMRAKAQEICDRLNAEGATTTNPPKWLQKQYSVPKPKNLVIPRFSLDLPGPVVRSIRLAVMKRVLLSAGFVKGRGGTYIRKHGDQIHLIDYQPARFGHQYTVNLGFHYAFLVPLFAGKRIKLAQYIELDCGLRARIGSFSKTGRDRWFDYGTDRALLEQTIEQNARDSLRIFEQAAERFAQPQCLLMRTRCKLNKRFIKPWWVLNAEFAPLLALHLGRRDDAVREVERLLADSTGGWACRYQKLLAKTRRSRRRQTELS